MKKLLFLLFFPVFIKAQTTTVNKTPGYRFQNYLSAGLTGTTDNPVDASFMVGDSAATKAMIIPRVQTTAAITNPRQGMVVYSISDSSFYYRSLFGWRKGITTSSVLNDLADVNITSPASGHYLTYVTNEWVNQAPNKVDTLYRTAGKDSLQFTIDGRYHAIKDSTGTTYTASNGLTLSGSDFKLGGTLTGNTTINPAGFYLVFSGSRGDTYIQDNGINVVSVSNSITPLSIGLTPGAATGTAAAITSNLSSTNTAATVIDIRRTTTGTGADGIGTVLKFSTQTSAALSESNTLISKWSTADNATRTSQFIVTGINSAATTDLAYFNGDGTMRWPQYGAGALTTDGSGNITAVSDPRYKDISGYSKTGLKEVLQLNPIVYKWNKLSGYNMNDVNVGFDALELKNVIPYSTGQMANGYLTMQDRPILAALTVSIKELYQIIQNQQKQINQLKRRK